ncbi:MAG TPA: hypothetical protein VHC22_18640 [Pirellulales bacterium]|nr:hypothetical protein [Pirellulales bacterium]
MTSSRFCILSMILAIGLAAPTAARACPFCNAQAKTLTEELDSSDVAVIAKLIKGPAKEAIAAGNADAQSTFEVLSTVKGPDNLAEKIEVLYFGQQPLGTQFLVFGVDPKKVQWAAPSALSPRAVKYVTNLVKLPKEGADRLAFFQEYLEDQESLLATDAYDEFARAPYSSVKELKERMHRDRLLEWIKDPQVTSSRRRLYLTMLGVCGEPEDIAVLEEMIKSSDRQVRTALDAMVACYLILKGPSGMPLIEDLFLKNKDAEYTDTYAAIMALRFLGQETSAVPKERLLGGLRAMLDRPQLADLVIPDLARWQDWSAMDKLVELFKTADEESSWVKVPVVNYLRACPKPEAKTYLAELAKLDPESVKRANAFFPATVAPAAGGDKNGKQPLVPPPDKPADKPVAGGAKGSKAPATGASSKGTEKKAPKAGQSSATESVPVVPALIGAVVAMADETADNSSAGTIDTVADARETSAGATTAAPLPSTARLSGLPGDKKVASIAVKPPAANRWQVASVTLGAAVAMLGLISTILKGN